MKSKFFVQDMPDAAGDSPLEFVSSGAFKVHNRMGANRPGNGLASTRELSDRNALCAAVLEVIQQSGRTLRLYSTDFEPWLYSRAEVVEACKEFLLAHENNRLQVLLHDSRRLNTEGHLLLPLIERISSRAEIRLVHPEYEIHHGNWLSLDEKALFYCPTPGKFLATLFSNQSARSRPANQKFDAMWAVARPDPDLRRMTL